MSDVNYTFSSLAGKVVMMDFFATWCGPCIAAMPLLREINDHYAGNSNFVLMSIDLETAAEASEAALESFAGTNNMNWWIFRDTVNMDSYYNIEFIPTLIIYSKTQYIYYSEIGMGYDKKYYTDRIDDLLTFSDSTDPVVNEIETDKTSFSVLDNKFVVTANISDETLRHVGYELEMGSYLDSYDFWVPSSDVVNNEFIIDPRIIYSATQLGIENATVEVLVEDFAGLSTTEEITIDIDTIVDAEAPEVMITVVIETDATFGQNFEIKATITDDLMLVGNSIELLKNGVSFQTDTLELDSGDTYSIKFFGLEVKKGDIITVKVTGEDVAGKTTVDEVDHAVTASAGLTLPIILATIFLANLIILPIRRIRARK
jgi:thiol-disulfide isomerase/thioredoxin